ncbi:MAG: TrmH family RNA methyltransferase [Gemmiger sp.]
MEVITSRDNARIKYACRVAADAALREKDGVFFAEGPKLCRELAKECRIKVIYTTQAALDRCPELGGLGAGPAVVAPHVAEKLAQTPASQGVFALFETPRPDPASLLAPGKRLLALENVQDPGNVGTLLRSAAAFGFDGVLLNRGCASAFAPKTVRASMGAAGRIPVLTVPDLPGALARLGSLGVTCLAAALQNSVPLDEAQREYPGGVCLVIGSEGRGLTDEAIGACTVAVRIPMTDRVESLNAGVAGSVLLWQFRGI